MFLILKLTLIILINSMYSYTQNSEIILLPTWNTTEAKQISLTFKVFGKLMQLNLHRNNQVVSSKFEIWKSNKKNVTEKLSKIKKSDSCFYLHENNVSSAIINICQEHGLEGLLFVENYLLEIRPLQNVFALSSFINNYRVKEQINQSIGKPHIIKRSLQHFPNSDFNDLHKIKSERSYANKILKRQRKFTIDLAVFVDAKAYNSMMKLLHFKIEKVLDVMLAYVNRIRALFCHPSLGTQIDISLVRLDFMEKQPSNLPTYSNNRSRMLYSFCSYARELNPRSDNDLRHWDIGLYITGLTIVEYFITILHGTTYLGASIFTPCGPHYACAFVTLPSEKFENTYELDQLARFEEVAEQSSVTAAHEIGHMLGLKDDSDEKCGENLPYIMCQGEKSYKGIEWSSFSQNVIKSKLKEHWCLFDGGKLQNISYDGHSWPIHAFDISTCYDYPGREQSAKAQCELFLNNKDANVVTLHDICKNLQCEMPHQNKSHFTGRPLNGTYCELEKECCDGKCVPFIKPPYISIHKYCEEDNWSEWKEDSCKSSCLEKSRGTLAKRRVCEHQGQKTANCAGPYYDVILCNDSLLCTEKRTTIAEFTIKKCFEFVKNANMTLELLIASGRQMIHDDQVPWVACAVFCRRKDTSGWYAPRQKMLDYGIDPYFPDGTWCHEKDRQHYYCRQHHCLPENYSFVESEKCKNNCIKDY